MSNLIWQDDGVINITESQSESEPTASQNQDCSVDEAQDRQQWLKGLAEEYIKLESAMPVLNFLPDTDCPVWVKTLEREIGSAIFPTAKLKEGTDLTPRRFAAIIGHQCAVTVWLLEWFNGLMKKPESIDDSKLTLTPEEIEKGAAALKKLLGEWIPALWQLAKTALSSCVDQSFEDMNQFLQGFSTAFAQKPTGQGCGSFGNSAFEIYHFMLMHWRVVDGLESVRHLHDFLVKVFGPHRVGELKRTEKICQRIGLSFRTPGRPSKTKIQTPAA